MRRMDEEMEDACDHRDQRRQQNADEYQDAQRDYPDVRLPKRRRRRPMSRDFTGPYAVER